jgi:hypothetical protein
MTEPARASRVLPPLESPLYSVVKTVACEAEKVAVLAGAGAAGGGAALRGIGGAAGAEVCARCEGNSVLGTGGGHDAVPDATGVFVRDIMGFTPAGVAPRTGVGAAGRSSPQFTDAPTGMRPPQTEQRARIVTLVILAGSSRKTDRHSGQDTFIGSAGLAVSGSRAAVGPACMPPNVDRP